MSAPKHTRIVKLNRSKIFLQLELTQEELNVLLLALKQYNNGYGNNLMRRIAKEETKSKIT